MKVEIEVISKEVVKPSSPTPNHLLHYNLSLLDQLIPQVTSSVVYFFPSNQIMNVTKNPSNHLKNSLSQVLTHYYPLAGRLIVDKAHLECNDEGVPYFEARVRCKLNDVENPNPKKFLPYPMEEIVDTPLAVQLNVFDCGGIAIGISMSHTIGDALSFLTFIQSWAAITRGEGEASIKTHFISSTLFPSRDISWYEPNSIIAKGNIVSKRFVFDASTIDALKATYEKNMMSIEKSPSRIMVLSNFILKRFMASTQLITHTVPVSLQHKRSYLVYFAVNLRSRMDPPLPTYAFGNYIRNVNTFSSLDDKGECYDISRKLREEIKKIDNDYILKLQDGYEHLNSLKEYLSRLKKSDEEIVPFIFTSLCGFPVYEAADFGWGKPTLVMPPQWRIKNVVIFMETKLGDGIEAHISLAEEDMAKFQNDKELLTHVSTRNPSTPIFYSRRSSL